MQKSCFTNGHFTKYTNEQAVSNRCMNERLAGNWLAVGYMAYQSHSCRLWPGDTCRLR